MKQIEELKHLLKDNGKELEENLFFLIKLNPLIINTLEKIILESKKENKLLVRKGLFNILKESHPLECEALLKHLQVQKFLNKQKQ